MRLLSELSFNVDLTGTGSVNPIKTKESPAESLQTSTVDDKDSSSVSPKQENEAKNNASNPQKSKTIIENVINIENAENVSTGAGDIVQHKPKGNAIKHDGNNFILISLCFITKSICSIRVAK